MPKPGYTACSFHRSDQTSPGLVAPNKARARPTPEPDIPPASLAAKDPSLIAAWPPILTRDRTPVPSMSPALNPPMGTAWPGGPATDAGRRGCPPGGWAAQRGSEAVPRRPAASAEARRRRSSAGPITANPAHLSQQGPRQACRLLPTPPPASASRPSQRSSTPPSLAWRTGTLGAVSGPIGPLPAETVCRYVSRHAVRYVTGYVRSTTPRHAAHTVRRYVCNIVRRYAVGYVPSNLAQ